MEMEAEHPEVHFRAEHMNEGQIDNQLSRWVTLPPKALNPSDASGGPAGGQTFEKFDKQLFNEIFPVCPE